jgi:hypothetical protein
MRMQAAGWGLLCAAILSTSCGDNKSPADGGSAQRPPTSVTLQSDVGDSIGGGRSYSYDQSSAQVTLNVTGGLVVVSVIGDESWTGTFVLPGPPSSVTTGTFSPVTRYPFHQPQAGGMDWSGQGRGCNTLNGWFAVDAVTYVSGVLTTIDLRFEQHCEGAAPALHGKIHWDASDPAVPPHPITPPPPGLWTPSGFTPPAGNYVHLESGPGDYIGGGATYDYTQANALLSVSASGGQLAVGVNGDQGWSGYFQAMSALTRLEPGYYGNLQRYPFHNPVRGGLSWSGEGRGCNTLTGWFVVDAVTYSGSTLTSIDLRFEQHCEGGGPALHGKIHWTPGDTSSPPGPVSPPPAGLWTPSGFTPPAGNYVHLESGPGDYVGGGANYDYTQANALLSVSATGGHLTVGVRGDQEWSGDFQAMSSVARLEPGYYGNLQRYPFQSPVRGGLSWSGQGRGCNTLTGWFVVDAVTYSGSTLTSIDLRFEQRCEGGGSALHGQIHWAPGDTTAPPGPVSPPPAGLWTPSGFTPPPGNYVHLESGPGDYIGGGATYDYTQANALLSLSATGGHLAVGVNGDQQWSGDFQAMSNLSRLEPGYYGNLQRYPFQNPVRSGLSWSGEGRGCNTLTGWFVVDAVTYSGSTLTSIDLRFEQHCEGGGPALHGQIHWAPGDTTAPPGPVSPPPAGLWTPSGFTPPTGNYVHLESDTGDYIGRGANYDYTQANAFLSVSPSGGHLAVGVNGDQEWSGDFQAMSNLGRLEPGYYGNLRRYPFHNPIRGGLSWSGEGRGCNTLTGWFVVDAVTYSGSTLTSIDLRFEQRCEGGGAALHGQIHWAPGDTTAPPGPVSPPPAGLWTPSGFTPPAGNYVRLESDTGDYIGGGVTRDYSTANATIGVNGSGAHLSLNLSTASEWWYGEFQAMSSVTRLEPGYYGNLQRYPFHNPIRGGLSWWGDGRGCNTLTGWFVVDAATYSGSTLTSIDLRFEQHCEGGGPALHGQIHWAAP